MAVPAHVLASVAVPTVGPLTESTVGVPATTAPVLELVWVPFATFEDGLGLPRLGMAMGARPLADYFPAQ